MRAAAAAAAAALRAAAAAAATSTRCGLVLLRRSASIHLIALVYVPRLAFSTGSTLNSIGPSRLLRRQSPKPPPQVGNVLSERLLLHCLGCLRTPSLRLTRDTLAIVIFLFDRRVRWPYKVRYIPPGFQLELPVAGPHQVWLCARAPRHALLKFRADVHKPHVGKGSTFG